MSMRRLAATCNLKGLSAIQFRVLGCLANHENDKTGKCNPSYSTIARETEISSRYAKEVIESLCDAKLILVDTVYSKNKCHSSNAYHFLFEKVSESEDGGEPQITTVVNHRSPPLCTTVHQGVVNHSSPKPVNIYEPVTRTSEKEATTPKPPHPAGGGGGCAEADTASRPSSFQEVKDFMTTQLHAPVSMDWSHIEAKYNCLIANGWLDKNKNAIRDWRSYFSTTFSFQIGMMIEKETKAEEERQRKESAARRMAYSLAYETDD